MLPMIVQQVTENVLAQLDLPRIVSQIPIEDIVEQVDIEAIVARIDLGASSASRRSVSPTEAVDALREQGMALDTFAARVVDRLLFRKRPRTLDLRTSVTTSGRAVHKPPGPAGRLRHAWSQLRASTC